MIDFDEPTAGDGDEEQDADLTEQALVSCPYCGEGVEIGIDQTGGGLQEYVEDCTVCCQPLSVRVALDLDGQPLVSVTTLDDG
jgi:hypothetical protein